MAPKGKLPRRMVLLVGVVLNLLLWGFYWPTLQRDVNGSGEPFMIDVGEIQGALATWGTLHPSGYPLYTILGNILTTTGRWFDIYPAWSTSFFSLICTLLGLNVLYVLTCRLGRVPWLAGLTVLWVATGQFLWLVTAITEVYALNVFLLIVAFWLAWRTRQGEGKQWLFGLAIWAGAAVSHHRTALLVGPALLWLVWPTLSKLRGRDRVLLMGAGLLPFLAYLYLPIRGWANSPWLYGNPHTWHDFWYIFFSREYRSFIQIPQDWLTVGKRLSDILIWLNQELGWLAWVGILGLFMALFSSKKRFMAVALWLFLGPFIAFGIIYEVPDKGFMLLPVVSALLMGSNMGFSLGPGQARAIGGGLIAAALLFSFPSRLVEHRAFVQSYSQDRGGRILIEETQRLDEPSPQIISRWGRDWFAYRYAVYATGELAGATIWPPHTSPRSLWEQGHQPLVSRDFFYQESLPQWQENYGPFYLSSASFGLIALLPTPGHYYSQELTTKELMGEEMALLAAMARQEDEALYLTLYWQALTEPTNDYSVFVHVLKQWPLTSPDDLIYQADSRHPVYGWYPTSQWVAGGVVRDDYRIPLTELTARPQAIRVGLYVQNPTTGVFTDLGEKVITWDEVIVP